MDYQFLKITKQARTLIVQINRPRERNALCAGLIRELIEVTDPIKKDMSASVVIFGRSGPIFQRRRGSERS